jgi:hypothetical protein
MFVFKDLFVFMTINLLLSSGVRRYQPEGSIFDFLERRTPVGDVPSSRAFWFDTLARIVPASGAGFRPYWPGSVANSGVFGIRMAPNGGLRSRKGGVHFSSRFESGVILSPGILGFLLSVEKWS